MKSLKVDGGTIFSHNNYRLIPFTTHFVILKDLQLILFLLVKMVVYLHQRTFQVQKLVQTPEKVSENNIPSIRTLKNHDVTKTLWHH